MVIGILGVLRAGRTSRPSSCFVWTVAIRASVIVVFAVLVFSGLAPTVLLLFGAVDLAGAIWTWAALKRDAAVAGARL